MDGMSEMATDTGMQADAMSAFPAVTPEAESDPAGRAQVQKIIRTIKADKKHHEKAFKRMRRDMFVAYHGRDDSWVETNYTANIAGRHVKQKTAALYAKNPRVVARRRETIDFKVWDENPQSIQTAMQGIQMAQAAMAQAQTRPDPMTGEMVPAANPIPPEYEQAFQQANELLADFQQGMQRRQQIDRMGKTLEVLFAHAMRAQKPLDFKRLMKSVVRRAGATGVGYVELAFQREYGPRPGLSEQLADARARIDHLRRLSQEASEGEFDDDSAELYELEESIRALQAEPEIILREGLIFDGPQSTKVIPDRMTRMLDGFVGARHVTVEYLFTEDQVEEMFEGVDLEKGGCVRYNADGTTNDLPTGANIVEEGEGAIKSDKEPGGLICVWKHYDKPSGLVYYVADGHPEFLRPPAAPDVFVEDFWPVYALTFNAVESEDELFPPSDVTLLMHMQREYNRSRQGMREHRDAARPRWVTSRGALEDEDIENLKNAKPFEVIMINKDPGLKVADLLEQIKVSGVDPNLYETSQLFTDTQLVVGSQASSFGGISQATATESAIAANSTQSSDQSSVDELDGFLSNLARAGSQILLREMTPERVMEIVGPGALWPQETMAAIADELFLDIEAGSSGKPNQAIEMANWEKMLPFLIQMPNINPVWLARETIRRLDDKADLTTALSEGLPSIVMQNAMKQAGTGDPATDPAAQGDKGGDNGPPPPGGPSGTGPAMGSNQV